jgi:hypothetical protein
VPERGLHPVQGAAFVLEEYEKAGHHLDAHGITVSGVKMDVAKMQARKDSIVTKMTKGVEFLFKKNKITWLQGFGKFVSGGDSYDRGIERRRRHQAKHVIIATGSRARHLPNATVDNDLVCDNEGALAFAVGAQAPGRDRRGRDRPGAGKRLAPAGLRSHDPRSAARISSAPATRRSPRRRGSSSPRRRASTSRWA